MSMNESRGSAKRTSTHCGTIKLHSMALLATPAANLSVHHMPTNALNVALTEIIISNPLPFTHPGCFPAESSPSDCHAGLHEL